MRRPPLAAILSALLCASCMGPRPTIPSAASVESPANWRNQASGSPESLQSNWWEMLGDPVLDGFVQRAFSANTDLLVAATRVEEARAQFKLARAQQMPTLDLNVSGASERTVSPFGSGLDDGNSVGVAVASFDADLFGRLASSTASARSSLLATQAARDTVHLAVISDTVQAYLHLRALDARLQIASDTLVTRKEGLQLMERRFRTGYSSRLELEQARAEYENAAELVPATQLAIDKQEDGLAVLLGETPQAIARGRAQAEFPVPDVPVSMPARILAERPDIQEAAQNIVAADHSLDAARAAFLPDVRLSASGGAATSSAQLQNPIALFSLGGSILAPIFEGGRLRADEDAAAARRDQAAFAYRRAVLGAFREVEDALASTRRLKEQEGPVVRQRDALRETLRMATNRYRAGYSPYLEQLDAERALLSAEFSVVQTRADRLDAWVALCESLGGGWTN